MQEASATEISERAGAIAADAQVSDSEPKMNLNLIWWRRWRLHDHMRVHALRERALATVSIPHRSARASSGRK